MGNHPVSGPWTERELMGANALPPVPPPAMFTDTQTAELRTLSDESARVAGLYQFQEMARNFRFTRQHLAWAYGPRPPRAPQHPRHYTEQFLTSVFGAWLLKDPDMVTVVGMDMVRERVQARIAQLMNWGRREQLEDYLRPTLRRLRCAFQYRSHPPDRPAPDKPLDQNMQGMCETTGQALYVEGIGWVPVRVDQPGPGGLWRHWDTSDTESPFQGTYPERFLSPRNTHDWELWLYPWARVDPGLPGGGLHWWCARCGREANFWPVQIMTAPPHWTPRPARGCVSMPGPSAPPPPDRATLPLVAHSGPIPPNLPRVR